MADVNVTVANSAVRVTPTQQSVLVSLAAGYPVTGLYVLKNETGQFASDADLLIASGFLRNLITASSAGVSTLNGLSGILSLSGVGGTTVYTGAGGIIYVSGSGGGAANLTGTVVYSTDTGNFASSQNLFGTGQYLWTQLGNLSGLISASYALKADTGDFVSKTETGNLGFTGSPIYRTDTGIFSTILQVALTGQTLSTNIYNLSGLAAASYALKSDTGNFVSKTETGNLGFTGLLVYKTDTGALATSLQLATTGQTLATNLYNLSGLAGSIYALKADTGNFVSRTDTGQFSSDSDLLYASGYLVSLISASSAGVASLAGLSGVIGLTAAGNISITTGAGNITISGATGSLATATNLASTGQFLATQLYNLSGQSSVLYALKSDTGNFVSRTQTGIFATVTNLLATGITLWNRDVLVSGALNASGLLIGSWVNNLTGYTVKTTGDQTVSGIKVFSAERFILTGGTSFQMGASTIAAAGSEAMAQGQTTQSLGLWSHAEGDRTVANGNWSHAEGQNGEAVGDWSHADGYFSKALGRWSYAGGNQGIASGDQSFVAGISNIAEIQGSVVFGSHARTGTNALFAVGQGNGFTPRMDAIYIPVQNSPFSATDPSILSGEWHVNPTGNDPLLVVNLGKLNLLSGDLGTTGQTLATNIYNLSGQSLSFYALKTDTGDFVSKVGTGFLANVFSKVAISGSDTVLQPNFTGGGSVTVILQGSTVIVSGTTAASTGTLVYATDTGSFATILALAVTGQTLATNIYNLSGYLNSNFGLKQDTGNFVSQTQTGHLTRDTVSGLYRAAMDWTGVSGIIVRAIGAQTFISGDLSFFNNYYAAKTDTGNFLSRLDTGNFASIQNLALTGQTLSTNIYNLSGQAGSLYALKADTGNFVSKTETGSLGFSFSNLSGYQTIWVPAGAMTPQGTGGGLAPIINEYTFSGASTTVPVMWFNQTNPNTGYAHFSVSFPRSWDRGFLRAVPYWTRQHGATGRNITWAIQAKTVNAESVLTANYNTPVSSTGVSTQSQVLHSGTLFNNINPGSVNDSAITYFRLYRDAGGAGNPFNNNLNISGGLVGVKIYYGVNKPNDN